MAHFALNVNGKKQPVEAEADCPLLYVLRDNLAMKNPRFGCGLGQCGACTVLVDGRATRSCTLPVSRAATANEILTLDGLGGVGEGAHAVNESILIDRIADRVALLAGLIAEL